MIRFNLSKFALVKRYLRFSNYEVYFPANRQKRVRFGYKFYQKIFRRYRAKKTLKINVRKPRIAVKRKTYFGKALEIKNKWSYLVGGIHKSKLARFVRLHYSKTFASSVIFANALESRVDVVVAKTSLVPYSWMVKRFIKAGHVFVDGRRVRNPAFKVPVNSKMSLTVPPHLAAFFLFVFRQKALLRLLFWPRIAGFEFSRRTFSLIKYRRISFRDIRYPFNFDVNYFYRLYPK
jgi:ribosomal protein S4